MRKSPAWVSPTFSQGSGRAWRWSLETHWETAVAAPIRNSGLWQLSWILITFHWEYEQHLLYIAASVIKTYQANLENIGVGESVLLQWFNDVFRSHWDSGFNQRNLHIVIYIYMLLISPRTQRLYCNVLECTSYSIQAGRKLGNLAVVAPASSHKPSLQEWTNTWCPGHSSIQAWAAEL